jgi:hypothetical protein
MYCPIGRRLVTVAMLIELLMLSITLFNLVNGIFHLPKNLIDKIKITSIDYYS